MAEAEVALLEIAAAEPDNAAVQLATKRAMTRLMMIRLDYKSARRGGVPDSIRERRLELQLDALLREFRDDLDKGRSPP